MDDLFLLGWMADYPAMDNFLYPLFHSSQIGANNYFFYDNPEVDRLIETARRTVDEKQRLDLYAQAEKIVLEDVARHPLVLLQELPGHQQQDPGVHAQPDVQRRYVEALGQVGRTRGRARRVGRTRGR